MTDRDDEILTGAFAELRDALLPEVTSTGPGAVRRTVRRRRLARAAGAAVLAVLIGVPVAVFAVAGGPQRQPDVGTTSAPPTTRPTTVPSPTPTLSPTPSAAPDGRISRQELVETVHTLPDWGPQSGGCPTRRVGLARDQTDPDAVLDAIRYVDVDADGAQETVALLRCEKPEDGEDQVVAFDRDEAGRIVTLGQVAHTDLEAHYVAAIASSGVRVRVEMLDLRPGSHVAEDWAQRQWRTYEWDGERFVQVDGRREFGPNPTINDLEIAATDLVFGPPAADGTRVGTVTVTVRNNGPGTVRHPIIAWSLRNGVQRTGAGWSDCLPLSRVSEGRRLPTSCPLPPMERDDQVRITFGFRTAEAPPASTRVDIGQTSDDPRFDLPVPWDPVGDNNSADVQIRSTG